MRNEINAVDLAFVVDTTGSMGGLIAAAQCQMVQMLQELSLETSRSNISNSLVRLLSRDLIEMPAML